MSPRTPLIVLLVFIATATTMVTALDIGVFMSLTGSYSGETRQAYDGLTLWRDYVNSRWGGVPLSNGTVIPINLIIRDDQSSLTVAATIWQSFVSMGLTVVIGGHTSMTVAASTYFEPFGVINIACCTGPDEVYTVNPRSWILGIHRSSADYPKGFLNQLHVRGKNRVAIVYNDASSFTITTADSAENFGKSIGMEVISKTSYKGAGYTNLNGTGGQQLAAQIAALERFSKNNTDFALFAICLGADGQDAARVVAQRQMQLNALFITVAPTTDAFINIVGPTAAEYVFSPLQWHNSMKFTDPILNSSTDFNRLFLAQRGYAATYTSASGAAAGIVLHLGLQSAMSTDKYTLIQALRELRADTFFGPVAFNRYQRNYGGSTPTIEILDSASHAVLPDVSAEVLTVLPPKRVDLARCPDPTYTNFTKCFLALDQGGDSSSMSTGAIVGIIVGCLALLVILATVSVKASTETRDNSLAPRAGPFAMAFTDIQSSTALWARIPPTMSEAVDLHHTEIRKLVKKNKGYEVKTIGDSFMVAFAKAENAIRFAVDVQEAMLRAPWTDVNAINDTYKELIRENDAAFDFPENYDDLWNGIRVRVGVHFGDGSVVHDRVTLGYDYYGTVVNTAARVESVGNGGQVLVTRAAVDAAGGAALLSQYATVSLGPQPLRGLDEPVELVQFQAQKSGGSQRVFAPLRLDEAEDLEQETSMKDTDSLMQSQTMSTQSTNGDIDYVCNKYAKNDTEAANRLREMHAFHKTLYSTLNPSQQQKALADMCQKWRVPVDTKKLSVKKNFDVALMTVLAKALKAHDVSSSRNKNAAVNASRTPETANH